ncbi:MAG: hypothetical protein IPN79_01555 [Saprospiraceae bacterium]|nr:hypothetical protein [Saprospiraceae bacterium]
MMTKKSILFYLLLLLPLVTFSQLYHPALRDFSAFTLDRNVVLRWTMNPGSTCFGTGILRSTDNINFTAIGSIEGVCGNTEVPVSYTFVDSFPLINKTAYYKLSLGLLGESNSLSIINIVLEDNKAIAKPQPFKQYTLIQFAETPIDQAILTFFSIDGRKIYETKVINSNEYFYNAGNFYVNNDYSQHILFVATRPDGQIISTGLFVQLQ